MKKTVFVIAGFVFISLLSGCLYTLHPIFTEKDLVFDARLLGNWQKEKDGSSTLYEKVSPKDLGDFSEKLKKNADKIYMATNMDKEGHVTGSSFGFLVKIGSNYFMDFYPAETEDIKGLDDFFRSHFIKLHSLYKIRFINNSSFELKQFDDGYMKNLLDKKQIRIKHEVLDDGSYLVTASTEELQRYITKYSNVSDAYYKDGISTFNKIK